MKEYEIPVTWEVWGTVKVKAESLKEANEKAIEAPLPDGEYITDSFKIDKESNQYQELVKKEK